MSNKKRHMEEHGQKIELIKKDIQKKQATWKKN